jgi:hypothetical protein
MSTCPFTTVCQRTVSPPSGTVIPAFAITRVCDENSTLDGMSKTVGLPILFDSEMDETMAFGVAALTLSLSPVPVSAVAVDSQTALEIVSNRPLTTVFLFKLCSYSPSAPVVVTLIDFIKSSNLSKSISSYRLRLSYSTFDCKAVTFAFMLSCWSWIYCVFALTTAGRF